MYRQWIGKRFADETTIHGIKEAYYARWIGKVFWTVVFIFCITLTILQVKEVFSNYVGESVGTRIFQTANFEFVDVPAFYYCNSLWSPQTHAAADFVECELNAESAAHASNEGEIEARSDACILDYAIRTHHERLVNAVIMPRIDEHTKHKGRGAGRSIADRSPFLDFLNLVEREYGNSLEAFVEKVARADVGGEQTPAHGAITRLPVEMLGWSTAELMTNGRLNTRVGVAQILQLREGSLSLNLNGVCWAFNPGPVRQRAEVAIGTRYLHVLLHAGGYGYEQKQFVARHGFQNPPAEDTVHNRPLHNFLFSPPLSSYATKDPVQFSTTVGLAAQDEALLFLQDRFSLDSKKLKVEVHFWAHKKAFVNRRALRCREDWTPLDQAHCNVQLNTKGCVPYLPPSPNYPETPLSNKTCLYDNGDSLNYILDYANWLKEDLASITRELQKRRPQCPRPCFTTQFHFEVIYSKPTRYDEKLCLRALESLLSGRNITTWPADHRVNIIGGVGFGGSPGKWPTQMVKNVYNLFQYWNISAGMPCSVIEYRHTEAHGQAYEEWRLSKLSDLAAMIGGTMGLWTGASVISFVQIIYICCLERFMVKIKQTLVRGETGLTY